MTSSRKKQLIASAIAPGAVIFGMVKFFHIEAWWLFMYFGFIFTLVSFMLASTFVEWTEKPELGRRYYQRPGPKR